MIGRLLKLLKGVGSQGTVGNLPTLNSSLPVPLWTAGPKNQVANIATGEPIVIDYFYAKVPRFDSKLVPNLYVQYGRFKSKNYRSKNARKTLSKIKAWSDFDGMSGVTGSGELGGRHTNVNVPRRNMFQVPASNSQTAKPIEYWLFYGLKDSLVFTADINNSGVFNLKTFYMLGNNASTNFWEPMNYHRTTNNKHRPQRQMSRQRAWVNGRFYARTVLVKNGRVIEYSAWSKALITKPNDVEYSVHAMKTINPKSYAPINIKAFIEH